MTDDLRTSNRVILAIAFFTDLLPSLRRTHRNAGIEEHASAQRTGGNLVHFNAYEPQYEAKVQYSTELSGERDMFLLLDHIDPRLRNLPMGARVMREHDEPAKDHPVAYWSPAIHPDGAVRDAVNLAKGPYELITTPEKPSSESYRLRVQQFDYSPLARKATGPLSVLLALIGRELSTPKRLSGRMTLRRP